MTGGQGVTSWAWQRPRGGVVGMPAAKQNHVVQELVEGSCGRTREVWELALWVEIGRRQ